MIREPSGETKEFGFAEGMTIAQAWALYVHLIYAGAVLPPDQELEVRQAFISGIAWLLGAMMVLPEDEDVAVARMEALQNEVKAFSMETQERAAAHRAMQPAR